MTAIPPGYDVDPERFRAGRRAVQSYGTAVDIHEVVTSRVATEDLTPVLDVGSGDGALTEFIEDRVWIGVDTSASLLSASPRPVVRADALALPVADASVGAVVALWMLYHLEDPALAIREAHRVLRPGGLFGTCTSRRDDSPELVELLGSGTEPSTFDAEEAPDLVASVFGAVEVEAWDHPSVHLPDRRAVVAYLRGRCVDRDIARQAADRATVPLDVTKRGVLVWARKPA